MVPRRKESIRFRSYVWLCLKETIRTTWDKADTGATIFGFIAPIVVHFFPAWESRVSSIVWEIPIACFASVTIVRLFLSPFLVYRRRDDEARALKRALRKRETEEELQAALGNLHLKGAELRTEVLVSEGDHNIWVENFEKWKMEVLAALGNFGMAAEYALFQNADATGPNVSAPQNDWQLESLRYDRMMHRHQAILEEILKSRPKLR